MIAEGNYIQWEPGGVMFFKEPGYVNKISECGKYVFVAGSTTGIPVNECRVINKLYRVMVDYPGKAVPEWHRFETIGLVDDFLKSRLERRDDYALIFNTDTQVKNLSYQLAEVAYIDNHHYYRRAKLPVAMRDYLNTPSDLIAHLREMYNSES